MMKKIYFSFLLIFVSICTFAQVNAVKVAEYFEDFEIASFNSYYDTIYNNGNDITMSVNVRFKLKKPYGSTNSVPQGSRIAIYYEPVNGNNIRTTINDIIINGQWTPPIGGIYSPYVQVNITIPKEYLLSGNLRTYFISPQDPVANYWGNGISVAAKSSRKLTVVNVANFIGPSQLCDEATYTIERPGTITLENAAGIATLIALGNNQWKVTRIGNAEGKIILKSTAGNRITTKYIQIGRESYQISGYDAIGYDGGIYSFSVQEVHGSTYSWSFSNLPPGATVQGNTTNVVRIFMPQRTSSDPTGGRIIMNLTINTQCGLTSASKQITYGIVPKPPGGGGGGLDPDPVLP